MEWSEDGFILGVKPHGETSAIINVLTRKQGRHAGLVRGGRSRRLRPVLQAGNKVNLRWNARLSEHLGNFAVEAIDAKAALLMEDGLSLAGLNAMSALIMSALPEREPHPRLYDVYEILLANLHDIDLWPALYVRFEIGLLEAVGYGLDLSSCAATGVRENLTHVSPRSGQAVCQQSAQPYLDRMLALPGFLRGAGQVQDGDITAGLCLSEYFLKHRVFHAINKDIPPARKRLVEVLRAADIR